MGTGTDLFTRTREQGVPGGYVAGAFRCQSLSRNAADVFFASLVAADKDGQLEDDIFVLELGIGVGLFARYFLDTLRDLCRQHKKDYYSRLTYIAADRSERMLHDLLRHGVLAEHPGRYRVRQVDALNPETLLADVGFGVGPACRAGPEPSAAVGPACRAGPEASAAVSPACRAGPEPSAAVGPACRAGPEPSAVGSADASAMRRGAIRRGDATEVRLGKPDLPGAIRRGDATEVRLGKPDLPRLRAVFLNYLLDCLPAAVLELDGQQVRQLCVRTCVARNVRLSDYTDLTPEQLRERAVKQSARQGRAAGGLWPVRLGVRLSARRRADAAARHVCRGVWPQDDETAAAQLRC